MARVRLSRGVDRLRAQYEGVDDGAAQGFEYRVEGGGRQMVLELELDPKVHLRSARTDRLEAPFAGEVAKRSVQQLHLNLLILAQSVARREFSPQDSARHLERGNALARGNVFNASADAPRQELRIPSDVVDQGEHLRRRIGHQCAALD